jgi:hypothetical protein
MLTDAKDSNDDESERQMYLNALSAVAVIVFYFKLFYFLRIFDKTTALIRMIV